MGQKLEKTSSLKRGLSEQLQLEKMGFILLVYKEQPGYIVHPQA